MCVCISTLLGQQFGQTKNDDSAFRSQHVWSMGLAIKNHKEYYGLIFQGKVTCRPHRMIPKKRSWRAADQWPEAKEGNFAVRQTFLLSSHGDFLSERLVDFSSNIFYLFSKLCHSDKAGGRHFYIPGVEVNNSPRPLGDEDGVDQRAVGQGRVHRRLQADLFSACK